MIGEKIKALRKERGMTLDELARAIGTSKQTIHRYESGTINNIPPEKITKLAKELGTSPSDLYGWDEGCDFPTLSLKSGISDSFKLRRIPILGEVACGIPIYAEEEHESFIISDGVYDADFCLRASGDSMIGARIYDGDIVFIRAQNSVDNGDVAVVLNGDEATLKRVYYYPEEQKLILSPENPKYAPLVYIGEELSSVKILGKAVAFQSRI